MTIHRIRLLGDPILRARCEPITIERERTAFSLRGTTDGAGTRSFPNRPFLANASGVMRRCAGIPIAPGEPLSALPLRPATRSHDAVVQQPYLQWRGAPGDVAPRRDGQAAHRGRRRNTGPVRPKLSPGVPGGGEAPAPPPSGRPTGPRNHLTRRAWRLVHGPRHGDRLSQPARPPSVRARPRPVRRLRPAWAASRAGHGPAPLPHRAAPPPPAAPPAPRRGGPVDDVVIGLEQLAKDGGDADFGCGSAPLRRVRHCFGQSQAATLGVMKRRARSRYL